MGAFLTNRMGEYYLSKNVMTPKVELLRLNAVNIWGRSFFLGRAVLGIISRL